LATSASNFGQGRGRAAHRHAAARAAAGDPAGPAGGGAAGTGRRSAGARRRAAGAGPRLIERESALTRARSTARLVADQAGLALLPADPVFDEWHAPACVLGLTPAQYPDDYKNWRHRRARNPDDALPGGESLTAFRDRAISAIQSAERLGRDHGRLVVVSHRMLIGAVTALRSGTGDAAGVFEAACAFTLNPATFHVHDLGNDR
jgi:broad specificity phosphatase PhoE